MVGCRRLGATALPESIRQLLATEVLALREELGVGYPRLGVLLKSSGEAVRKAAHGTGGPQVLQAVLDYRGQTLDQLIDKHGARVSGLARGLVGLSRYQAKAEAINTHLRYAEHDEETVRKAADAVAVGLDSEDAPNERWWYEQIDAELKRARKGKPKLGERVLHEDDE